MICLTQSVRDWVRDTDRPTFTANDCSAETGLYLKQVQRAMSALAGQGEVEGVGKQASVRKNGFNSKEARVWRKT